MKFNWQGDDDDATCKHGKYLLRAECMDKNVYWWVVYDTSVVVTFGYQHIETSYAPSMAEARQKAEQIVREL